MIASWVSHGNDRRWVNVPRVRFSFRQIYQSYDVVIATRFVGGLYLCPYLWRASNRDHIGRISYCLYPVSSCKVSALLHVPSRYSLSNCWFKSTTRLTRASRCYCDHYYVEISPAISRVLLLRILTTESKIRTGFLSIAITLRLLFRKLRVLPVVLPLWRKSGTDPARLQGVRTHHSHDISIRDENEPDAGPNVGEATVA